MAYRVIYKGGEGEIIEKKSRFIATVKPIESEEEATAFIAEMKKKYWDARHNCSAFVIGANQELTRCSDDGEPAQTAGRPMLDVLLKEGVTNVAVVVTRYFGGTLLGITGLTDFLGSSSTSDGALNVGIVDLKTEFFLFSTGFISSAGFVFSTGSSDKSKSAKRKNDLPPEAEIVSSLL